MSKKMRDHSQIILDAALSIYKEEGFEAISMRKVAKKSGIAVGTVYNRFENKQDLIAQLLAGDIEHTKSLMMQTVFAKEPEEALRDLMAAFTADMMQDSRSIISHVVDEPDPSNSMEMILFGAFKQIKQTIEELLCRVFCKYNKILTEEQSGLLADMVLAMLQTVAHTEGGCAKERSDMITGMVLGYARSGQEFEEEVADEKEWTREAVQQSDEAQIRQAKHRADTAE